MIEYIPEYCLKYTLDDLPLLIFFAYNYFEIL